MIEKIILVISMLIAFTVFKNTVFRSRVGSRYLDKNKNILISEAISLIAFLVTGFFLESIAEIPQLILAIVEGLFLGWMTSLAGTIGKKNL